MLIVLASDHVRLPHTKLHINVGEPFKIGLKSVKKQKHYLSLELLTEEVSQL